MIDIHDWEIDSPLRWKMVISGMRNSWGSHDKSDSVYLGSGREKRYFSSNYYYSPAQSFKLGADDLALATKLVHAGADHGKYLRQLDIILDLTASGEWWTQLDTYKIGTTRNSTSSMHTLGRDGINEDMFDLDDFDSEDRIAYLSYVNNLHRKWVASGKKKGTREWRAMVKGVCRGMKFRSMWSANYQVLRNIYFARKHHRLDEWHKMCDWIETLPFSVLITTKKGKPDAS